MPSVKYTWGSAESLSAWERDAVEESLAQQTGEMIRQGNRKTLDAIKAIDAAIVKGAAIIREQEKAIRQQRYRMAPGGRLDESDPIWRAAKKNYAALRKLQANRTVLVKSLLGNRKFIADVYVAPVGENITVNVEVSGFKTRQ